MKPVDTEPGHNRNLFSAVNFYSSEDPNFMTRVGLNLLQTEENFSSLQFHRRRVLLCMKHCVFRYACNQLSGQSFRYVNCVLQL
jgi:hypothetical protein